MKLTRLVTSWLRTLLPFLLGIVVLSLVIAWLAGMFTPKIQPAETVEDRGRGTLADSVGVDEVHEVVKEYFEEAVGTLKAATRTKISARIMAPIEEIHVNAGDMVEAGDLLITLDGRDVESRLNQAESALEGAKVTMRQAEADFQRDSRLLEKDAVSKQQFEHSKSALETAQSEVERAEEAVAEAKVRLSYTEITAPQAGTIVDRLAEPGDTARPGIPLLVLYDPGSLRLEVPVMENLALKLKKGDVLTVRLEALDREVEAVVDEIVPQAETASRSFLVKVALPRSEGFYEGMFGRLLIPAGSRRHLCLPTRAIQTMGQNEFVYVVEEEGEAGKRAIERRFITTGRLGMKGYLEVLSGVEAGERVLLLSRESRKSR
ncbi:MAG: efflux RND transporter periplasmic adaptor subunit [Planctomycetota bacterium]